jgi:uncharacterized oligopeptide transporter (OPT) family protein
VLGVTFSIPLRRALVVNANLPYPEGVAAAEVLTVGSPGVPIRATSAVRENKPRASCVVIVGSIVSAGFALLIAGRAFAGETAQIHQTARLRSAAAPRASASACSSRFWAPVT